MYRNQQQLLETLLTRNLVTADVVEQVTTKAAASGRLPEEILVAEQLLDENKLTTIKASLLNLPPIDLTQTTINKKVLALVPALVALQYQILPFRRRLDIVDMGLVNPQNFRSLGVVEGLARRLNCTIQFFIISPSSFRQAIRQYDLPPSAVNDYGSEAEQLLTELSTRPAPVADDRSVGAAKIFLVIARLAVEGRASDIHIEPTAAGSRVRYRVDGILRTALVISPRLHDEILAWIKNLAQLPLERSFTPQHGRFRLTVGPAEIDFRLATFPLFEAEKVVLKLFDATGRQPSLEELGLYPFQVQVLREALAEGNGTVLVVGPSGAGKSQTLYALINLVNQENNNIVTLEDPITGYLAGVNQSEINADIGYDFASALQAALRQDPDVVMIEEIRDQQTAYLTIQAGLTNQLMLAGMYAHRAVAGLGRLFDFGLEPFAVAQSLQVIVAQRLVRMICPDCRQSVKLSAPVVKKYKKIVSDIPADYREHLDLDQLTFFQGAGCARCGNLGYRGRTAVAEVLPLSPAVREVIAGGKSLDDVERVLLQEGFVTLLQAGLLTAAAGSTTLEEVERIISPFESVVINT